VEPQEPQGSNTPYRLADSLIVRTRTKVERPPEDSDPYFADKSKTDSGFKSRRQWRWAFAQKKPWARAAAHATAGGPKVRYRRLAERKA